MSTVDTLKQALLEAHNAMHQGDYKHAHDIMHAALGIDGEELNLSGKPFYHDFDIAFRTAVRKHNVPAAYIILDLRSRVDDPGNCRVLTGGHVDTLGLIQDMYAAYLKVNSFTTDTDGTPKEVQG